MCTCPLHADWEGKNRAWAWADTSLRPRYVSTLTRLDQGEEIKTRESGTGCIHTGTYRHWWEFPFNMYLGRKLLLWKMLLIIVASISMWVVCRILIITFINIFVCSYYRSQCVSCGPSYWEHPIIPSLSQDRHRLAIAGPLKDTAFTDSLKEGWWVVLSVSSFLWY